MLKIFSNISDLRHGNKKLNHKSATGLTSSSFIGYCHSQMRDYEINNVLNNNGFTTKQSNSVKSFINEARQNNFLLFLMDSNKEEFQEEILRLYLNNGV